MSALPTLAEIVRARVSVVGASGPVCLRRVRTGAARADIISAGIAVVGAGCRIGHMDALAALADIGGAGVAIAAARCAVGAFAVSHGAGKRFAGTGFIKVALVRGWPAHRTGGFKDRLAIDDADLFAALERGVARFGRTDGARVARRERGEDVGACVKLPQGESCLEKSCASGEICGIPCITYLPYCWQPCV
jgi:hypothetical protein